MPYRRPGVCDTCETRIPFVRNRLSVFLLTLVVMLFVLACGALPGRRAADLPTSSAPGATSAPQATSTPTPRPLPTLAQATPTPLTEGPPAPVDADQNRQFVVTEKDLEATVNSDEVQRQAQTENFNAEFTGGKVILTVDSVRFGLLSMGHLKVVGTLTATDGVVHFNAESVEPNNMLTAAVPGLLERIMTASTAGYYVEDVQVEEGQIVYTVRANGSN